MPTSFGQGRGLSVFPPFIKFLLFANVAVFLVQSTFLSGLTFGGKPLESTIMNLFALWPFESGFLPWQLISYQFMHGSLTHLFFNMLALWMFGMELENLWGTRRFALYYTLAGVTAGIVHLVISPLLDSHLGPTIGASGSIMGVLLGFGLTFPTRPVMMFPIFFPIPAKYFVMIFAGIDLFSGVMNSGDGIAHFAHLGGALGGWLLLKFGEPLFRMIDRRDVHAPGVYREGRVIDVDFREPDRYTPSEESTVITETPVQTSTPTRFVVGGEPITQEAIDAILDKISQAGYHSLTDHEKQILFDVSRQL